MTGEELIGKLWELGEIWGPLVIIAFAVFAMLIMSFVVFVFVKILRSMAEMDRDWNDKKRKFKL